MSTRERVIARVLWTLPTHMVAESWSRRTWHAPILGGEAELAWHGEWLLFAESDAHGTYACVYGEPMARQFGLAALRAKRFLATKDIPLVEVGRVC